MKLYQIIFLIGFLNTFQVFAQAIHQKIIDNFEQLSHLKNASIGIQLLDLKNGESIGSLHPEKVLIPASTLKLITTASALELLGNEYKFTTQIGYSGQIKQKILKGDIILIGGGDPTLGSEYFQNYYFSPHFLETWAQKIKAAGIEKISGNLILDASIYDNYKIPATWIWEDIGNYYGAGANAFTVYDNLFRITFHSPLEAGKQTQIVNYYPKIEGLILNNEVLSSNKNTDLAYVFGSPLDKTRSIRGTIPKNKKAFTIKAAVHHPEELLANDFLNFLAKEGIFIQGEIIFRSTNPEDFKCIYVQESPPLRQIVKVLNYQSINLFAEHLIKQIAYEKTGKGSTEKGIIEIEDFWKNKGTNTNELFVEDGSGLSHFNAVSPDFFTEILYQMKDNQSFIQSLPAAGQGTIYQFKPENFRENELKTKSGSMTRVRCYAGYLTTNSGQNLAFSIMVNHFSGSHSILIENIQNLLVEIKNN